MSAKKSIHQPLSALLGKNATMVHVDHLAPTRYGMVKRRMVMITHKGRDYGRARIEMIPQSTISEGMN